MALCFVSNKELTVSYSDIARRLQKEGERIVWLSPSTRWSRWLIAEGWPSDDVLNLPDFAKEWQNLEQDKAIAELAGTEAEAPETVSNVIQMCRNLRRMPPRFAYAYLAVARRHVEPFLRNKDVEVVFGEGTWGFELITWLICQRHGIPMLTPGSTRIPGDRFFFADAVSSDFLSVNEVTENDRVWAEQFLAEWLDRPVQPGYMVPHAQGYKSFRARWLNELAIGLFRPHLNRHDATLWPLGSRIADRVTRLVNALTFRYLPPHRPAPVGERYVLYPLHHQPEASIDVFGSLNSNQVALIETLSRLLPTTHKLWIKEHKGGISDRSFTWFDRISRLPNVRFIDPWQDIYRLIRGADLVVTISGTAGYEAALMGVPTVGLSKVFFAPLLSNRPGHRSHPLEWSMTEILSEEKTPKQGGATRRRSAEFLAHLYANSFPGNPIDLEAPASRRAQPDYLRLESEGFSSFIRGLRVRAAAGNPSSREAG
jgi:hypothetical protein